MTLRLDEGRLRPMTAEDRDHVLRWRNSERVRRWMYTTDVIRPERHAEWFALTLGDPTVDYQVFEYAGRPVGLVYFTRIDRRHETAYWGFYAGEVDVPKGIGSLMELRLMDHAFDGLGLRKVSCEVIDGNDGVVRLHRRFGQREQARYVEHVVHEGRPNGRDRVVHARARLAREP